MGDASQFQQMGLFPMSLSVPQPKRLKHPQKPKCTVLQWTKTEPLAPAKALPGYHAVLLDSDYFHLFANLHRCPQVRCAQTSRKMAGHFYLPQLPYLKAGDKPLISGQIALKKTQCHSEHPKQPNPIKSRTWGTTNSQSHKQYKKGELILNSPN